MTFDLAVTEQRMLEAQTAYHKLQTGSLREVVDHNGTRITYTRADATKLKEYISELQSAIDAATCPRRRRRVIIPVF